MSQRTNSCFKHRLTPPGVEAASGNNQNTAQFLRKTPAYELIHLLPRSIPFAAI